MIYKQYVIYTFYYTSLQHFYQNMDQLNTTNLFAGAFGALGTYFTARSASKLSDSVSNLSTTEPRPLKNIVLTEVCTVSMLTVGLTCLFVSLGVLAKNSRS